ncbi:hypothetical protein GMJLKIPL_2504 [Methylobacterium isbiliense]|uniref:Uncharacterized protein n=1 Tax=Methylobacterium isbiliense TaxID=315478 RepID=A0ABQ4SBI6_9HYPH|nr:hypothetical protein GMJLKIPL_2504 [Methylobacterium isbiliense]
MTCAPYTPRPAGARAYTCRCGVRWALVDDGWIKVGGR